MSFLPSQPCPQTQDFQVTPLSYMSLDPLMTSYSETCLYNQDLGLRTAPTSSPPIYRPWVCLFFHLNPTLQIKNFGIPSLPGLPCPLPPNVIFGKMSVDSKICSCMKNFGLGKIPTFPLIQTVSMSFFPSELCPLNPKFPSNQPSPYVPQPPHDVIFGKSPKIS